MAATAQQIDLLAQTVTRAILEPDWFCQDILKCKNDQWQSEMMNAVADLDRIRWGMEPMFNHDALNRFTVRAMHGPGKTHWIAKMMHWWGFTRRGRCAVTASKEKQLTTRVWPEFRKVKMNADRGYQALIEVAKTSIIWANDPDWCAIAESAASPENLAGLHDDWILYLVEEASGVAEEMFPAIEGMLTTDTAILAMIGNPTRTTGEFHASHMKRGTKELYYKKAIQHHESSRISPKWVNDMIGKYGIDSPVVQVRVFGNFVDAEERQLLALAWLQDAIEREFKEDGSLPRLSVSADVADGGIDSSIVSVAWEFESFTYLKKQYKFNFPTAVSPPKVAHAAAAIYEEEWKLANFIDGKLIVDAVGVGSGTAGTLILEYPEIPVIVYKGGASSDDPEEWDNRRTQSYIGYRNDLRDGKIIIAEDYCEPEDWDDFLAQHVSIKLAEGTEKREALETKKQMRSRGIKSPDMPDSIKQHWTTAPAIAGSSNFMEAMGAMEDHSNAW